MSGELPFEEIRPAEWAGKAALQAVKAAAFAATLLLSGSSSVSAEKPATSQEQSDVEVDCIQKAVAEANRICAQMEGYARSWKEGLQKQALERCMEENAPAEEGEDK